MKNVIYYFSGTGNSMRAAEVIAKRLEDTYIVSMKISQSKTLTVDVERIGFVFPVYNWTMPEIAVQFIRNLHIPPQAYIFAIAMPSFINGKSMEKLASLLKEKDCTLSYSNIVYSVGNYVVMYPPMPNPKKRIPKTEYQLSDIADEILQKRVRSYSKANLLVDILFHKMMDRPIAATSDKHFAAWDDCISCGLCSRICPCNNIVIENGKPVFQHHCNQCMACISYCPKEAINFPHFTRNRKKYHNPYISPQDMMLYQKHYN